MNTRGAITIGGNPMEMGGTEKFPGQDHTRRSSQIAGTAISELMDRTTYLEGIVQARETEMVDLMERQDEERGKWERERETLVEDASHLARRLRPLETLVRNMATTMGTALNACLKVKRATQKGRTMGSRSSGVVLIRDVLESRARFHIRQVQRHADGEPLEYVNQ